MMGWRETVIPVMRLLQAKNNVEYNYDNVMMNAMDESRDKGYKVIYSLVACEIYRVK